MHPLPLTSRRKLITLQFKFKCHLFDENILFEYMAGQAERKISKLNEIANGISKRVACCGTVAPQFRIFTMIVSISRLLLTAVKSNWKYGSWEHSLPTSNVQNSNVTNSRHFSLWFLKLLPLRWRQPHETISQLQINIYLAFSVQLINPPVRQVSNFPRLHSCALQNCSSYCFTQSVRNANFYSVILVNRIFACSSPERKRTALWLA